MAEFVAGHILSPAIICYVDVHGTYCRRHIISPEDVVAGDNEYMPTFTIHVVRSRQNKNRNLQMTLLLLLLLLLMTMTIMMMMIMMMVMMMIVS